MDISYSHRNGELVTLILVRVLERVKPSLALPENAAIVEPKVDHTAHWLALVASLASIASTVFFFLKGEILLYVDAYSHLEIAHRVLFSPTSGPVQLGYVWLPLPHILMLPFVWDNTLYYDGLAGSISSMVSYVVASVLIYKIVFHLTGGKKLPGLVGAFVFMANPNILYMQSTPMTELLLFATMLGAIYGIQRWIQTERRFYFAMGSFSSILACLARYEAWMLMVMLFLVVVYTCWRRHYPRVKVVGLMLMSAAISGGGAFFWMAWNEYFFHNPLDFQDGQYAKPSNWVHSNDPLLHHPLASLETYWYAMRDDLSLLVIGLAVAGVLLLLIRHRLSAESMPTLVTLVFIPFFVAALDEGQRPMTVASDGSVLYSVRFGLIMIIPAAICIGYLASIFKRRRLPTEVVAIFMMTLVTIFGVTSFEQSNNNIYTLREPISMAKIPLVREFTAAGAYLHSNYHGGVVLAQFFGNEEVLFDARISSQVNIYEGSYNFWKPALKNPLKYHVEWIVMRSADGTDTPYQDLHGSAALNAYKLVYNHLDYQIYKRK